MHNVFTAYPDLVGCAGDHPERVPLPGLEHQRVPHDARRHRSAGQPGPAGQGYPASQGYPAYQATVMLCNVMLVKIAKIVQLVCRSS